MRRGTHRSNRRGIGFGGASAPASTPASFGTLQAWIDPRYNITHTGDGTAVTDWNDHSSNAHNGVVNGAPTYEATGWNGSPSVLLDGTDDALFMDALAAIATGSDQPITVVMAVQCVTAFTTNDRLFSFGHSSTAETNRMHSIIQQTSNRYQILRRDDAALLKSDITNINAGTLNRAHLAFEFTGTLCYLFLNGVVDSLVNGGDLDVGTITLDRFALGCGRGSTNVNFASMRVGPVLVYSTLTDRAGAEAWLASEGYAHA